jgi:ATP-dependent protease ClpP protease subunit
MKTITAALRKLTALFLKKIRSMPKTYYINFYGGINPQAVQRVMSVCSDLIAKEKPDTLYFMFSSPGGNVDAGVVLYNFLRSLPVKIVMHNTGAIDSVATVIFHAADDRRAAPAATFLFHGVTWSFGTNAAINRTQLEEVKSSLIEAENKIAKILPSRCKLSEADVRKLFAQGETKDVTFATDKGIIQVVSEPRIPANEPFITLNFS